MFFSIIIPLYNRPQEINELLESLTHQRFTAFEVLVIEDGSMHDARTIVERYSDSLDVHYYSKPNEGQGFTRNFGFARAKGDYFIVFDSDCLIPPDYLSNVVAFLKKTPLDAFGGPDAAHESFTPVQKAISYSMTSPFTTGGIRGNRKHLGTFHPRSFNMGVSRKVWERIGGFKLTRLGEDIEYSIRIQASGFKIGLISEALVYHKRRTDFWQFYKQLHFFGRARINIYKHFPRELKLVHFFPAAFVCFLMIVAGLNAWNAIAGAGCTLAFAGNILLLAYATLIFFHAWARTRDTWVALLSVAASFIQLVAYGLGFMQDFIKRVIVNRR
ncbi:Glycosyltransferase, catalytic subunit of cellulose synthase and poly-beta-1,6-N-acetylglucosamine synthase [Parapedobacter luteus]|uniref:Glycosyltransferase, catalytic subunit of cellulose synthase and poly-beta-1,6-N-acetylglucosamine synthase n=1 Tax=Parapedobacter luteus TaxID=623280 RepID=A0A1T5F0I0_9SPHI|nr:glycosyltransferase [Parapedobacter luteus]SKB89661.1 Glycosyltransferase, catalytic subunit of cellulose synthase and poly-beta-1,6-N-acetylglucosamine synthase [Parapedobacter luteus]